MDNIINAALEYVQENIYPLTFRHLVYIGILTWISSHITSYFLNFRLVKWIYIGTIIVIIANIYNQGNELNAATTVTVKDIFKLATI